MAEVHDVQRFVFVFPMASGHINPSLPIARALGKLGHEVHYVCFEQMREAIESAGATFHAVQDVELEMWEGRPRDLVRAYEEIQKEHGFQDQPFMQSMFKLKPICLERQIPGMIRFLMAMKPAAVVYCPMACEEAACAAHFLGIPHVALNTIAGPGAWAPAMDATAKQMQMTLDDLDQHMRRYAPGAEAHRRMEAKYGRKCDAGLCKPYGVLPSTANAAVTLVTTIEDLYDPISPELQLALDAEKGRIVAVGPLLDEAGAKRAAGHKSSHEQESNDAEACVGPEEILDRVSRARESGRAVVLASMGTVITGDMMSWGWEGRMSGADGEPRGLKGKELCRGAWGGVFDAFGAEAAEEGPLIVLALGPQAKALGEIQPPPNAICVPVLPQVDILKAGVDIFLTHGGQNSFTEALANSCPLVVCPGFADQPRNAQKAVDIGVGLKVDRPDPNPGEEAVCVAAYRADVKSALLEVFSDPSFKSRAAMCGENLQRAGGVSRAVELVLEASRGTTLNSRSVVAGGA